jgi:DNA-binding GntR family transcriptional regulator
MTVYASKGDIITDTLRDKIARGELPPGTLLRQRQLAQEFNVSPTPVREALRRLESEGLVSYEVHRGSRVATVDLEEQEENLRVLAALESLAASLASEKITESDLDEIRALERRFAECEDGDPALKELNWAFHFRIYECARSPLLLSLMRLLWRAFPQGPQQWRPHEESIEQHTQLAAALAARDADRAASIVEKHVLGSITWMKSKATTQRDAAGNSLQDAK